MHPPSRPVIHFDLYRLDARAGQLFRADTPVYLRPKTFAVLEYMTAHPGELVSKDELLEAVWNRSAVSEDVVRISMRELRAALGDDRSSPRFIATVLRRGYRFIAPVSERPPAGNGVRPGARSSMPDSAAPIGRDTELALLHEWLADALTGARIVGFVSGETGIGKTTLVDAFLDTAAARGGRVRIAKGQCIRQYGAGEAYAPVLDAIGRLGQELPGGADVVRVLQRYAPAWLQYVPELLDPERRRALFARPSDTRQHMLHGLVSAIDALAAERPLILAFEDVHWSDDSTVDLLNLLAQRPEPARVLVLCTLRAAEATAHVRPIAAVHRELRRKGLCRDLQLAGLNAEHIAQYLARRFADHRLARTLSPLFTERTEGNPFFMVTLADHLIAHEVLVCRAGIWALRDGADPATTAVPDRLRAALEPRLERLAADELALLEAASVSGTELDARVIAAATGETLDAVEAVCERLTNRDEIIRRAGEIEWPGGDAGAAYVFRHALYQQVLYERLAPGRRRRLHRAVGDRLEAAYAAQTEDVAARLAAHFARGGDAARAIKYHREAATGARLRFADAEVRLHLEAALALIRKAPDTVERTQQELEYLAELGNALLATNSCEPAVADVYTRIDAIAKRLELPAARFMAKGGLFFFHVMRGNLAPAHALATALVEISADLPPAIASGAHTALGSVLYLRGRLGEARVELERARALFDPEVSALPTDIAVIHLGNLALVYADLGLLDAAEATSEAAVARADTVGTPFNRAYTANVAAQFHATVRDVVGTSRWADEAMQLSAEYAFPVQHAGASMSRGWCRVRNGDHAGGLAELRQGMAAYATTGQCAGKAFFYALYIEALLAAGKNQDARAILDEAFAHVQGTDEHMYDPELWRLEAEWRAAAAGDDDDAAARDGMRRAAALAHERGTRLFELRAAMSAVRLRRSAAGKRAARRHVASVLSQFSGGFEHADLVQARTLSAMDGSVERPCADTRAGSGQREH